MIRLSKESIRILIVDDHSLIRQGLMQILEIENDLDVIALAEDGEQAIQYCINHKPDVVLMDINMPNTNGVKALRRIKEINSTIKVIMLSIHDDGEYYRETEAIGAEGFVLKGAEINNLIHAIKHVYNGGKYVDPGLKLVLENDDKLSERDLALSRARLTKREYEVLELIAEGMNNKEIGERLYISEKTVKNHVSNIFRKLEVNDRTQAAIFAFKNNIKKI